VDNVWRSPDGAFVEVAAYMALDDVPGVAGPLFESSADRLAVVPLADKALGSGIANGRLLWSSPLPHTPGACKAGAGVSMRRIGSFSTGNVGVGSVEILTYDKVTGLRSVICLRPAGLGSAYGCLGRCLAARPARPARTSLPLRRALP
jgi:hypothetical protein